MATMFEAVYEHGVLCGVCHSHNPNHLYRIPTP